MTELAHIMSFTQTHRKIWVVFNRDLLEAMEKARLFLPTDLDTEHVAQSTQTHKTVEYKQHHSVASSIHSTTKYYMLCHSPLMPVTFQFVGVT